MSFVIMNVGTEKLYRKHYSDMSYPTERGAKIAATKMNNSSGNTIQWVVMSRDKFEENHNPMVTVKNLLSGMEVQIRRSDRGGCTDPSTERFHCM